jgi:hypothetical protein
MGDVWKARDARVDRTVAIKFAQGEFTERFEREARAIASLNHPNIATLYDLGPNYLVMEYVEGRPVGPVANTKKLFDIAVQIADGLAAAHAAGIVHRDLKPDNILITPEGRVKILDFGIAKRSVEVMSDVTSTMAMTNPGTIVGTVAYMSPEQARGRQLDTRSDQFSFGLILYEMTCAKRAFERESSAETMAAIIKEEPEPLPASTPAPLRWTVERCLTKDPALRYESTRDLYHELRTIRDHLSNAVEASTAKNSGRPRMPWLVAVAAILALVAGVGLGSLWRRPRPPAERSATGTRLGGPRISMSPRVSPDGQLLAFLALVDGSTQLGVMKMGADSWTLLTHAPSDGYVQNVCWSRDGSKLYFDRYWEKPVGVYTIPPLGGDPVLLLENAWEPQALPDVSLLVLRPTLGSQEQIYRFWPENGKLQALPAFLGGESISSPMRVFADGREAAYWGTYGRAGSGDPPGIYVLDLDSGKARRLDPRADINRRSLLSLPMAIGADDKSVITLASRGDTYDLIDIRRDGTPGHSVLLSLRSTELPWYVDVGPDRSIYLDQIGRPYSILQFPLEGAKPEQNPVLAIDSNQVLPLPDGRVILSTHRGKSRVLIGQPNSEMRALLQTQEESTSPLARVGSDAVALLVGSAGHRRIALASVANGEFLWQFPLPPGEVDSIAVSPDRTSFYFTQGGIVYAERGAGPPKRIAEGDTMSPDSTGRFLYAKQFGHSPIRLVKIDTASGNSEEIRLPNSPRLTASPLSPAAVDARGRVLMDVATSSTWFYHAAMLDTASGKLTIIPVDFSGDIMVPGWTADGGIIGAGATLTGSLWRYRE